MRTRTLTLLFVVALLVPAGAVIGAKGGKKPPETPPLPLDGGFIYFSADEVMHRMDPDGTDVTSLTDAPVGEPSMKRHCCPVHESEERFFLICKEVVGDPYPNGVKRHEIFAVCEDGAEFQLTNAPSIEPDHLVVQDPGDQPLGFHPRPKWSAGDTRVSYTAMKWGDPDGDGTQQIVEWGFYTLAIDPEKLDLHTAAVPDHVDVYVVRKNPTHWSGGRVNVSPSWSPDGTAFVYNQEAGVKGIWRADLDSGEWSTEQVWSTGEGQEWSPAGQRILFKDEGGFISMDPYDSTDQVFTASQEPDRDYGLVIGDLKWSPGGTHFIYEMRWYQTKKVTNDLQSGIFRDRADGGGDFVELTKDMEKFVGASAWVADE
jgi:hypothetical protein